MKFLHFAIHNTGRLFALLAALCAVSVFCYGALLLGAVSHAAGRAEAERAITNLRSQVSGLEARYLTQAQALTPEHALALGFVEPTSISTVFAGQGRLSLYAER